MKDKDFKHTNKLIDETSPYLLQHAHNPVDWVAWNTETLAKAKSENKLILISIGYSACHWCHVMEHESFEYEEVANVMNDHFICIKVDREERPDVDQVYMDAVQKISGQGGWPLNCFALPDGRPFWGGTYFPKEQWIEILNNIVEIYKTQKKKLEQQAADITEGINRNDFLDLEPEDLFLTKETLEDMVHNFSAKFDKLEGGTKGAPKFPMPNNVLFLLRYYARTKKPEMLNHVELTLQKMTAGGIYDQIGGGFARYSVDDQWHVPHFEKMLYDNAQLVSLYAEAYQLTKNELYKKVVEETLKYVDLEMTNPEGGFYSTLDADSEGVEGKFYVWEKKEIETIIKKDSDIVIDYFGIDKDAYWEDGNNVLIRVKSVAQLADKYTKTDDEIFKILSEAKRKLLKNRSERVRPGLDDKILTSWNALMIKGFIDAYAAIGKSDYLETAIKNADFLLQKTKKDDGGLFHNYKNDKATIDGFLEDYAFMIEALIELYQATFDEKWISQAKQFMEYTIRHFYDDQSGMFYFTSDESNDLIARKMEVTDNVIPASNSSIANSLFFLSLIYEKAEYKQMAEKMLKQVEGKMIAYPSAFSNWGILYLNLVFPFHTLVITGEEALTKANELNRLYFPNIIRAGSIGKSELPIFKDRFVKDKTMIYVCTGSECKLPVENIEEALGQIE
ncbi:MAG: thioredoxin domain-containing protein [Bacteroidales bacterium]|nr:thioredoxin domain-containing protein [Bacteroidales bacterium]